MDYPFLVLAVSLVTLWLAAQAGSYYSRKRRKLEQDDRSDFDVIQAATLTLLGLIIGFTFSMAITRYDQRKQCEAEEANAIGTEYLRAGLLPSPIADTVRDLLRSYVDQRVLFYTTRDRKKLRQIGASIAQLQTDLWSAVRDLGGAQPTPVVALAVSGMNDVLNSESYAQAAWWNRIPIAAWTLMGAIAVLCNCLLGFTSRRPEPTTKRLFLLPLIVSISFFLIADIDSPRGGVIRVRPQNLGSVSSTMRRNISENASPGLERQREVHRESVPR